MIPPDDQVDPLDEVQGPHLEVRITRTQSVRATTLWGDLERIKAEGGVGITVQWNGINARNWDQSFFPLELKTDPYQE